MRKAGQMRKFFLFHPVSGSPRQRVAASPGLSLRFCVQLVIGFNFAVLLLIAGCGYHFAGTGGQAPGNINSIAVDVLDNRTAQVGIEAIFTNAILSEFIRWKRLPVKPHNEAEGILGGSIFRISTQDVAHSGAEKTLETRVTITLALTLKRAETNEILWENPSLSYYEEYFETGDALLTDRLRREAIREIASFLAEKIHNDIFEAF
jgi:hypothetical protein